MLDIDPVKLLKEAISQINTKYLIYNEELGNYNSTSIQQVERSFAYELYHQLSIILEKQIKSGTIQVSAEIVKKTGPKARTFPDIIIHEGQGTCGNQFLVGEIKRKIGSGNPSNKEIAKDFKKLKYYLNLKNKHEDAEFLYAVFIMINCNKDELISKIRNLVDAHEIVFKKSEINKIICFAVECVKDKRETHSIHLKEIIR